MTSHAISARNRAMISYVRGAGNDLLEKIDRSFVFKDGSGTFGIGRTRLFHGTPDHGTHADALIQLAWA